MLDLFFTPGKSSMAFVSSDAEPWPPNTDHAGCPMSINAINETTGDLVKTIISRKPIFEILEPVLNINKRLLQVLNFRIHRPENNCYFFNTQCHIGDEEINFFTSSEQRFDVAIMK